MQAVSTTDEITSGFPVLFTKDEFKENILDLMLAFTQQAQFIFMADSSDQSRVIWRVLSPALEDCSGVGVSGNYHSDMALAYADIEHLGMARTLMQLYEYGVQGILDSSEGRIDCVDGYENQVSRLCYDLNRSEFLKEWDDCGMKGGGSQAKAAERCLYVCELANARLMLEGSDEGYFLDDRSEGFLSIRQMALLSGMTEASIRTLAGPNRKNRLMTTNDNRSTLIDIETAKAWLISKARYVPISEQRTRGAEDLTSRKFVSCGEFEKAIQDRLEYLASLHGEETINLRVAKAGVALVLEPIVPNVDWMKQVIGEAQLLDVQLMRKLADALELPAELFALRASEAVMQDKLREIEKQLKQVQKTK